MTEFRSTLRSDIRPLGCILQHINTAAKRHITTGSSSSFRSANSTCASAVLFPEAGSLPSVDNTPPMIGDARLESGRLGSHFPQISVGAQIRMCGPKAARVMSEETGRPFPIGHTVPLTIGNVETCVVRVDESAFDFFVSHSASESLWDHLARASIEVS